MPDTCWCHHSQRIHYDSSNGSMCGACNCGWKHPTEVYVSEKVKKPKKLIVSLKLNKRDIAHIRILHSADGWEKTKLAARFGISVTTVSKVLAGRYGEGEM